MKATLEREFVNPRTNLEKEIAAFGYWFHNLHLPDGTQTAPNHPLGDFPKFKWKEISPHIPEDLSGMTALDIGCNAGFYTFELAKRGANVLGIDLDESYLKQANWAKGIFGFEEQVEFKQMQIYELPQLNRKFDIVIFMGVFYHLRYPLLALDIVAGMVNNFMVFQTLTMPGDEVTYTEEDIKITNRTIMLESGWPKMAFIENTLEGDLTNWWAANHSGIEAMMRSSGLEIFNHPAHEIYFCRPKEGFNRDWLNKELFSVVKAYNK